MRSSLLWDWQKWGPTYCCLPGLPTSVAQVFHHIPEHLEADTSIIWQEKRGDRRAVRGVWETVSSEVRRGGDDAGGRCRSLQQSGVWQLAVQRPRQMLPHFSAFSGGLLLISGPPGDSQIMPFRLCLCFSFCLEKSSCSSRGLAAHTSLPP